MTEDEIKEATRAALAAKPVVISLKKKSEVFIKIMKFAFDNINFIIYLYPQVDHKIECN